MQSRKSPAEWNEGQASYWNEIAKEYNSLYETEWSKAEDTQTTKYLRQALSVEGCSILDLACGTGLGYELAININQGIHYVGLDISSGMLREFRVKHPYIPICLGSMSDLSMFQSESFDAVICLYTSLSYSNSPDGTLQEVYRVLRPNGCVFVSVLSKWSLRRLLSLKWGKIENYRTRNSVLYSMSTSTWAFSRREIVHKLASAGFNSVTAFGLSVFGGLIEQNYLWRVDTILSRWLPNICNIINAQGVKGQESLVGRQSKKMTSQHDIYK